MTKILFSLLLFFITLNAADNESAVPSSSTEFVLKSFSLKDVVLQKKENYYTIILATVEPGLDYNKFIQDNKIKYNAIAYHFGQENKYVKIIFGAYETYEDAFNALIRLDTNLLSNRPYVERVSKHIHLFHKYDNVIED
ncbi:MAG: hypothetical protein ACNI3C_07070 [Candidatus Marinarcus sp.]|uniref:hypothetical protein n=1 Tax=Candidatus Marinarcus sp. TaxID=3100987 RepID=UPI003AFF86DF